MSLEDMTRVCLTAATTRKEGDAQCRAQKNALESETACNVAPSSERDEGGAFNGPTPLRDAKEATGGTI
jgi:hypothetical protein